MEQTLYEIIKYGETVLHQPVEPVHQIDQSIIDIIYRMKATMIKAMGVGLAANQVGLPLSVALIDTSLGEDEKEFFVLINPIIKESHGSEIDEEGCLSVPGYSLKIPRNISIFVTAIDPQGHPVEREYNGFLARVIQHEVDHLSGRTIVDRVSPLKRRVLKREIEKRINNDEW